MAEFASSVLDVELCVDLAGVASQYTIDHQRRIPDEMYYRTVNELELG